ncbi:hypothetical protein NDU88_006733 [Pleurodeles waltl]|uniref:Uncharacterized protein n=1 Tax=Pleurodeles waltl TaxID=8319 RepID=A0AAV7PKI7_PLEWA|nr:hypothetical protein NDU88_006733 [Pleurodeles waltl]
MKTTPRGVAPAFFSRSQKSRAAVVKWLRKNAARQRRKDAAPFTYPNSWYRVSLDFGSGKDRKGSEKKERETPTRAHTGRRLIIQEPAAQRIKVNRCQSRPESTYPKAPKIKTCTAPERAVPTAC